MATVQIVEYAGAQVENGVLVPVPSWPPLAVQLIDCSSAAAATPAPLNAATRLVRVLAIGGSAHVVLAESGGTPASVVSTSAELMPVNVPEYRPIPAIQGLWSVYAISGA